MSHLTHFIGAVKLATKAHAPTIMVVSGVAAMAGSVFTAGRQTLKIEEVLEPHVESLERIQSGLDLELDGYNEKTAARDRGKVYTRVAVDMTKLYAVPGVLFIGGTCLIFGGHRMMLQRNATLALAFTGLKQSFDAYRSRVRDKMGHEADQAFMHGATIREIYDDESGKAVMVASRDWDDSNTDPYNRVFSRENSSQWVDDIGANKLFLQNMQRMAQITLGRQGYLYLSDVYKSLGFPETDISRVVGWKEKVNPDGSKDIPILDFGIDKPMPDDWIHSREKAIYLDFNCQGLIIGGKVQKALEKA